MNIARQELISISPMAKADKWDHCLLELLMFTFLPRKICEQEQNSSDGCILCGIAECGIRWVAL